MTQKISALVHTLNSARYLRECLSSLKWIDEIIIIDMGSTDETTKIAEEFSARIFSTENVGYADPARQFGLSKATHEWILTVDSDEVIPESLSHKLKGLANNDQADVVHLSFRNFFFGKELRGTGWSYKDIHVPRFFKKSFLTYGEEVHDFHHISAGARQITLSERHLAVIHFNYDSISHFIQKLDRYTNFEAKKLNGANFFKNSICYQFTREFGGRFFVKCGFKDGLVGLYLSLAMAFYRASAIMKSKLPDEKTVVREYKELAAKVLKGESV